MSRKNLSRGISQYSDFLMLSVTFKASRIFLGFILCKENPRKIRISILYLCSDSPLSFKYRSVRSLSSVPILIYEDCEKFTGGYKIRVYDTLCAPDYPVRKN